MTNYDRAWIWCAICANAGLIRGWEIQPAIAGLLATGFFFAQLLTDKK